MTPSAPRPALTPEREKELLGLIEAYWRIAEPTRAVDQRPSEWAYGDARKCVAVSVEDDDRCDEYGAEWAESEACLREVAGECMVRMDGCGVDRYSGPDGRFYCLMEGHSKVYANDVSRPVALLKAFVSAFGSEPRHE